MKVNREQWPILITYIKRFGAVDIFTWLLHDGSLLTVLGAQFLYVSQPFLPSSSAQGLSALANLLEDRSESEAFLAMLKGIAR